MTKTPQEAQAFDAEVAELHTAWLSLLARRNKTVDQAHYAVGDKHDGWTRGNPWVKSDTVVLAKLAELAAAEDAYDLSRGLKPSQVLAELAKLEADIDIQRAAIAERDDEWRADPWHRYILCLSANGHIHNYWGCSTLRYDTPVEWHPDLSGLSVDEAVKVLGPILCSVCFPSAPLGYRRDKKDVNRAANDAAKAAKAEVKYVKALRPAEVFRVDGDRITTVAACKQVIRDEVAHRNLYGRGPSSRHAEYVTGAEQAKKVLLARDGAHGGMTEAEIATLIARAEKRNA
jgi:hypothetical protein